MNNAIEEIKWIVKIEIKKDEYNPWNVNWKQPLVKDGIGIKVEIKWVYFSLYYMADV